ncbi:hypothetical protein CC2G_009851 [Coprinopsis cinerea AmutBmut pab1-1]|nr:hypothetical protein CC2G_009851 [Coprinopsis cinerea AmutBmut pab1-1]
MAATIADVPPLLGDGNGNVRILVLGNSGSGKSTAGARLGQLLGVPFVSLDQVHWEPGWRSTPNDEFKAKVRELLSTLGPSWVIDGDYHEKLGTIVLDASTDIVWLDPPLLLYFPRLFVRTLLRLVGWVGPCSPGCPERVSEAFFSRDSILLWCLSHHFPDRRKNLERMAEIGIRVGPSEYDPRRRMRRLGGWGKEYNNWMKRVEEWAVAKKLE